MVRIHSSLKFQRPSRSLLPVHHRPAYIVPQYRVGQEVRYKPVGGIDSKTPESTGIIRKVITKGGELTGRNVTASPKAPRYEIENTRTRKRSAIKEENILETAQELGAKVL